MSNFSSSYWQLVIKNRRLPAILKWLLFNACIYEHMHKASLRNLQRSYMLPYIYSKHKNSCDATKRSFHSIRAQCSQAWARTKDSEGDEDTEVSIHRILYAWLLFWQSSQEWLWQLLEVNPISNLTKDISFYWLIRKFLLTYCLLVTEKLKNIPSVEVHPCELYSGCGLYK